MTCRDLLLYLNGKHIDDYKIVSFAGIEICRLNLSVSSGDAQRPLPSQTAVVDRRGTPALVTEKRRRRPSLAECK